MARKRKNTWGGRREGAGRPPGSLGAPNPDARTVRVAIMLSEADYAKLVAKAKRLGKPPATAAYESVKRGLRG